MRSWIWGGCLATVTAGGVYFVLAGHTTSHCGPCVACAKATAAATETEPSELPASLARAAEPFAVGTMRVVSYDEPPLANPLPAAVIAAPVPQPMPAAGGLLQAGFVAPVPAVEVAPMPRTTLLPGAQFPLAGSGDKY